MQDESINSAYKGGEELETERIESAESRLDPTFLKHLNTIEIFDVKTAIDTSMSRILANCELVREAQDYIVYELERRLELGCEDAPGVGITNDEELSDLFKDYPLNSLISNTDSSDHLSAMATALSVLAAWLGYSGSTVGPDQNLTSLLLQIRNATSRGKKSSFNLNLKQRRSFLSIVEFSESIAETRVLLSEAFESDVLSSRERKFASNLLTLISIIESGRSDLPGHLQDESSPSEPQKELSTVCRRNRKRKAKLATAVEDVLKNNRSWVDKLVDTQPFDDRVHNPAKRENTFKAMEAFISVVESQGSPLSGDDFLTLIVNDVVLKSLALSYHPIDMAVLNNSNLGIDLKKGVIRRLVRQPEDAFHSDEYPYIETTTEWKMPLPGLSLRYIREIDRRDDTDISLEKYCTERGIDVHDAITEQLASIAEKLWLTPIAIDQFENQLPLFMKNMGSSDAEIYWILGRDHHLPPVQCYYETSTEGQLGARYIYCLDQYFRGALEPSNVPVTLSQPDGPYIGACCMDRDSWKQLAMEYGCRYDNVLAMAEKDPIGNHSEFTHLTLHRVLVGSGIRMTDEALAFLIQYSNEDFSLTFPQDKVLTALHDRRLAGLPKACGKAIADYIYHLKRLALALYRRGHHYLAGQFQAIVTPGVEAEQLTIGFFTDINDSFTAEPVTRNSLNNSLGDDWLPRIEEARVQLCSFLKNNGTPDYAVEDQLGHISMRCPTFSLNNNYSIEEFRNLIQPDLDAYMAWLGWDYDEA